MKQSSPSLSSSNCSIGATSCTVPTSISPNLNSYHHHNNLCNYPISPNLLFVQPSPPLQPQVPTSPMIQPVSPFMKGSSTSPNILSSNSYFFNSPTFAASIPSIQLPPIHLPIDRTKNLGTSLNQPVAIALSKSTSVIQSQIPRHKTPLQLSKSSPSISPSISPTLKSAQIKQQHHQQQLFDFYYPIKKVAKNPIGRPRSKRPERCAICKATETPEWRKGEKGQDLCNACGLKLRKEREARKMLILNNILNKEEPSENNIQQFQNTNFMDSKQYFTSVHPQQAQQQPPQQTQLQQQQQQSLQPTVPCRQSGNKCIRTSKDTNTSNVLPNKKLKM
ncbi:hypothetical protein PPL_12602 [Heterostelium album PN500]|uniref:GATA-type domain-containing protein n=1 Tax=Heterostelium pallidum (strain ATCC 26659 / Pp 5 / PN500) TaxID=670386 RepID=D3BN25_HETP5|nr:hypothetical protein PPL_12602 [Heterostelium album PN500]EFA77387.1 hypothetical protein PPL_12602 [Heterostelium album PN500]|eukprot:XP_020429516.1 hypothetical protein PPL_12602 [Heterostelium album PN500]